MPIKRSKRDINKEMMFSKIMPSYNSSYNDDYAETTNQNNINNANLKKDIPVENINSPISDVIPDKPFIPANPLLKNSSEEPAPPVINNSFSNSAFVTETISSNNFNSFTAPDFTSEPEKLQNVNSTILPEKPFNNDPNILPPQPFVSEPEPVIRKPEEIISEKTPDSAAATEIKAHVEEEKDDDAPKFINITEYLLQMHLENTIKMFKSCNCELCKRAISLNVLNSTKPEYVYRKPSEISNIIKENQYTEFNQQLIRVILDKKINSPHNI